MPEKPSECPLQFHPDPYFRRDEYALLNGEWDFEITKQREFPSSYANKIIVPFAVETKESGVGARVGKDDFLHYRKLFDSQFGQSRALLRFFFVDQVCDVYLNGKRLGHHEGGYLPFSFLVDLKEKGNDLRVVVQDDVDSPIYPRGKQSSHPGNIWYTPTSGIYGSVLLERIGEDFVRSIKLHPDFDSKSLSIEINSDSPKPPHYRVYLKGQKVLEGDGANRIDCSNIFLPWTPEEPNVFDLDLSVGDDLVHSQFAFRKIGSVLSNGHRVLALNDKPYFLSGVLDQGYWPSTGLTPPSLEAAEFDIIKMKELGFNCLRKHIKAEMPFFYALCDRLGMAVVQDMVNAGAKYKTYLLLSAPFVSYRFDDTKQSTIKWLGRGDKKSRDFFVSSLPDCVDYFFNFPCVLAYTLFNEGWGQFNSAELTAKLASLDCNRLIDSCSGWYDQGAGDFDSHHVYFKKVRLENDHKRILSLSEFGGYKLPLEGHAQGGPSFGYGTVKDEAGLTSRIERLYTDQVLPLKREGLCVAIYTQLSDVEGEMNGLLTYDRAILKVDGERIRKLNSLLRQEDGE